MNAIAPSGTSTHLDHELFGCQNLITFRTDVQKDLKVMKNIWREATEEVSPEFMERMQGLQAFQDRINMARAVCGDGPFVAFKVDNLSEESAATNGHPQVVHVQTHLGKMKANSGELFCRV